jgi:2-methylcitrate dehydratase PrpD
LTALQKKTQGSKVHITLTSGEILKNDCLYPPGNPKNPLSDERIADKFRTLARSSLNKEQTEKAIDGVWALNDCTDMGAFMKLFAA